MISLDRFAQGLRDPQAAQVAAYCAGCGGEIYQGELVYTLDGCLIHHNASCLAEHVGARTLDSDEALEMISLKRGA